MFPLENRGTVLYRPTFSTVSQNVGRVNATSRRPIAASSVVGLRCMYFIVVAILAWPASFWMAPGGAPSEASIEQERVTEAMDGARHFEMGLPIERLLGVELYATSQRCRGASTPSKRARCQRLAKRSRLVSFARRRGLRQPSIDDNGRYASTEALCHAFANAGLPSPSSIRGEREE